MSGWVYIARSDSLGLYKIGSTMHSVDDRIKQQQTQNRFKKRIDLRPIHRIEIGGLKGFVHMAEEVLHGICRRHKYQPDWVSEWFKLPIWLVRKFQRINGPLHERDVAMMRTITEATWLDARGTINVLLTMLKERARMRRHK